MANLNDILSGAQGGQATAVLGREFGLTPSKLKLPLRHFFQPSRRGSSERQPHRMASPTDLRSWRNRTICRRCNDPKLPSRSRGGAPETTCSPSFLVRPRSVARSQIELRWHPASGQAF